MEKETTRGRNVPVEATRFDKYIYFLWGEEQMNLVKIIEVQL